MAIYTIKTDAEMYDIEAENDEEAIEIAREDIRLSTIRAKRWYEMWEINWRVNDSPIFQTKDDANVACSGANRVFPDVDHWPEEVKEEVA